MSVLTAILYLVLAFILGTTAVALVRLAVRRDRIGGLERRERGFKGAVLQAALTFTVCFFVVPSLRPDSWGTAWYYIWVDALPVLAGVAWALLPERGSESSSA